ncbi:PaaI family thioesterase [Actinoallomurus sp. NPDC052274]|uniref:PaaI family thioesterase n=1 Tax=Actinoallomurus sp. NPDC052274 TaxID=3155420 RepID=UPI003419EE91
MISPDELLSAMPFAGATGLVIESASAEEVTGRLPWAPERCTAGGVMHGGALITLADSVGAACAFLNLPPGANTTTVETSTRFFRGVRGGDVRAVARPLHTGRTTIVVQTDLYDGDGRRVAQTTQTQAVLLKP